jgi:hypothetical protein
VKGVTTIKLNRGASLSNEEMLKYYSKRLTLCNSVLIGFAPCFLERRRISRIERLSPKKNYTGAGIILRKSGQTRIGSRVRNVIRTGITRVRGSASIAMERAVGRAENVGERVSLGIV